MKNYTDIKQSKILAGILPIESADSHYVRKTFDFMGNPIEGNWSHPKYGNPNSKFAHYIIQNFEDYEIIPCWSLAALLDVIPDSIYDNTDEFSQLEFSKRSIAYHDLNDGIKIGSLKDNLIDACYEIIIKLHEQNKNLFNYGTDR